MLKLQCSEDVQSKRSEATWRRTRVRDKTPLLLVALRWVTGRDAVIWWIPTCVVMTIAVSDTAIDRASYQSSLSSSRSTHFQLPQKCGTVPSSNHSITKTGNIPTMQGTTLKTVRRVQTIEACNHVQIRALQAGLLSGRWKG